MFLGVGFIVPRIVLKGRLKLPLEKGDMAAKQTYPKTKSPTRRGRGFASMSGLIQNRVKTAGEKRGFAVMRLLTHWAEIVGDDLSKMATPVKIGYSRDGFGAVLTVLTTGPNAPLVQMQLPQIRERVNACYGYSAISRVAITQTAPVGFHDGRVMFEDTPEEVKPPVSEEVKRASAAMTDGVENEGLKAALETLSQNYLSRKGASKGN